MKAGKTFIAKTGFVILFAMLVTGMYAQTNHDVSVDGFSFVPDTIYIYSGDTVTWTNNDGSHNVNATLATWPDNPEGFGNDVASNWTFTHVFTLPGIYDYQCDPHTGFGMYGQVRVVEDVTITLNFTGMAPHAGQDIWFSLVNANTGEEVVRTHEVAQDAFMVAFPGVQTLRDYRIDFFADHNGNGYYDEPPTDHVWRIELDELAGDTTVDFSHNTNFTNVEWQHTLSLDFSGMAPHVGQMLSLELLDKESGDEFIRVQEEITESFTLIVPGIEPGASYLINFYADLNSSGMYDAPPTDHAWQLNLDDVVGDTSLAFVHNIDFTDIGWMDRMKFNFNGMSPHIGQLFALYVYDRTDEVYVDTLMVDPVEEDMFSLFSYALMRDHDYNFDFYADLSGNGEYDAPPMDHAWRRQLNGFDGDSELTFNHNTTFTDIFEVPNALESIDAAELNVFPNPASDALSITTSEFEGNSLSVEIFNTQGQLIQSYALQNEGINNLNIEGLQEGLFYMKISDGISTGVTRFIKR